MQRRLYWQNYLSWPSGIGRIHMSQLAEYQPHTASNLWILSHKGQELEMSAFPHPVEGYQLSLDYEQSLFFLRPPSKNAREMKMTTSMTEGARRVRPPSFFTSRGFTARRSRAFALPSLSLKQKRDWSRSNSVYK